MKISELDIMIIKRLKKRYRSLEKEFLLSRYLIRTNFADVAI